jgi:hypothetical protein
MVYLWMKCLMVIPQIWRHLLNIGWTGLQHFPQLCLHLGSHAIFLTENWVPKIHFNSTILASSLELLHPRYVICVNSPCFSRLHVIIVDWFKNQVLKNVHIFFLKPMASIYKTSYIYIIILYEAHISNFFVGCHYQIAVQLVFQVQFQKSIVGLSLSLKRNVQCKFAWTQFVGIFDVC